MLSCLLTAKHKVALHWKNTLFTLSYCKHFLIFSNCSSWTDDIFSASSRTKLLPLFRKLFRTSCFYFSVLVFVVEVALKIYLVKLLLVKGRVHLGINCVFQFSWFACKFSLFDVLLTCINLLHLAFLIDLIWIFLLHLLKDCL